MPRPESHNIVEFHMDSRRMRCRLLGDLELTPGLNPNVCRVGMLKTDFDMIHPDYVGTGSLCFYFRADVLGEPDVRLDNWTIYDVEDGEYGALEEGGDVVCVERFITLVDARRVFRRGSGGMLTAGVYNKTQDDGLAAMNDDGTPTYSVADALGLCMQACGLVSLTGRIPPELDLIESPRDLQWDGAPAVPELTRLMELVGLVLFVRADGEMDMAPIDPSAAVEIPDSVNDPDLGDLELPFETINVAEDRPELVLVTSAPTLRVKQTTLTGPHEERLAYVGLDVDGKVKPIEQLSYAGGNLAAMAEIVRGGFFLGDANTTLAAQRTCFKWLKIATSPINDVPNPNRARLPILHRLADVGTYQDNATQEKLVLLPRLRAKTRMLKSIGWVNAAAYIDLPCEVIDARAGIIASGELLGRVDPDPADNGTRGFSPLADGDIEFQFAHEAHDEADPIFRYYLSLWRVNDAGEIEKVADADSIRAALRDPAAYHASRPELREFVRDGVSINSSELDSHARRVATTLLRRGTRQSSTRRFKGFHEFTPNGQIASVTYSQDRLMTTIAVNRHFMGPSAHRQELRNTDQRYASDSASARRMASEDRNTGTVMNARPRPEPYVPFYSPTVQFWAEIGTADGDEPPYDYEWVEILETGAVGAKNNQTHGTLSNRGEDPGRLDPDGTSAQIRYPPLPAGTRVRVQGWDAIAGKWWFDASLQPSRNSCPPLGGL